MPELKHLLSHDSTMVLRAVQAQSDDPSVVDSMTRTELYDHLAIRSRMGVSREEIEAKIERWADMRDTEQLFKRARRLRRQSDRDNTAKV
jgi:hypothetical protein